MAPTQMCLLLLLQAMMCGRMLFSGHIMYVLSIIFLYYDVSADHDMYESQAYGSICFTLYHFLIMLMSQLSLLCRRGCLTH